MRCFQNGGIADMHLFFLWKWRKDKGPKKCERKQWWDDRTVYLVNGGRLHGEWQITSPKSIGRSFHRTHTFFWIRTQETMKLSEIFHGNNRKYLISVSDSIFIYLPESRQAPKIHCEETEMMAMVKATTFGQTERIYRRSLNVMRFVFGYRWCCSPTLPSIIVHQTTTPRCALSLFVCACVCLAVYVTDIDSLSPLCRRTHLPFAPLSMHLDITHLSLSHPLYAFISHAHSNGEWCWAKKKEIECVLRLLYICNPINFHILWPMTNTQIDMWSLSFHHNFIFFDSLQSSKQP